MTEMRIMTVRQPWAWALVHGGKTVENRPRNIAGGYRGLVAVHVGLRGDDAPHDHASWPALSDAIDRWIDQNDSAVAGEMPWWAGAGKIIGVAELVDVHACRGHRTGSGVPDCAGTGTPLGVTCSPWAEPDRHHLVFANPRPLAEPIPFTGALGLRKLDAGTTAQVLAAIA